MGEANILGSRDPSEHRGLPRGPGGVCRAQPLFPVTSHLPLHLILAKHPSSLAPHRPVMEVPCDKPLPEEQARLYLRDIILGLEYCE